VISAPMPGKVTRVSVQVGDPVKKGQTLVVMEAMKMEYALAADHDGSVQEINAQVGDQVALGAVMVRVVAP
jgi:biotin carboxyl carrier protein